MDKNGVCTVVGTVYLQQRNVYVYLLEGLGLIGQTVYLGPCQCQLSSGFPWFRVYRVGPRFYRVLSRVFVYQLWFLCNFRAVYRETQK